jgi:hypothetical protein
VHQKPPDEDTIGPRPGHTLRRAESIRGAQRGRSADGRGNLTLAA